MKNKFFTFLLLITIVSGTLFISCKKEDDDSDIFFPGKQASLKYLSIANAKNLYISTAGVSSRAATSTQKIFKITEDGYTEEVKYLDKDKNEISITQQPTAIYPVNNEYIFVGFGYNSSYLVRKTDGAVFDFSSVGAPYEDSFKNGARIKKDEISNIYFISNSTIVKINISNPSMLEVSTISPSTDCIRAFDVDKKGNIIYGGTCDSSSIYRIRKTNGGLFNVNSDRFDYGSYWCGLDGNFYYASLNKTIKKYVIDNAFNITQSDYGSKVFYLTNNAGYKFSLKNYIYIVSESNKICEVYNPSETPREVVFEKLNVSNVTNATSTDNYYFLSGSDSSSKTFLIRVNPEDDSYIHLLPQNEYDVYSFTASEENGVIFNALRMSDGKKVIGKVGINGGAVKMIDEESDVKISYLERIN